MPDAPDRGLLPWLALAPRVDVVPKRAFAMIAGLITSGAMRLPTYSLAEVTTGAVVWTSLLWAASACTTQPTPLSDAPVGPGAIPPPAAGEKPGKANTPRTPDTPDKPEATARERPSTGRPPVQPGQEPERAVDLDPDDKAAFIFDQSELRTYDLRLSPEDLAFLDADPEAEEYVDGTLEFEGETYPVGIRYKGSAGQFEYSGCLSPEGAKQCTKMSMKVAFDFQDEEARFFGLRKLNFHANFHDPSMMKERIGYSSFREFGVAAPRAVHARLSVNGRFVGLFTLVEQVDGRFTRARFGEGGEGNLYKEVWPLSDTRSVVSRLALLDQLETNKDENPEFAGMLALGIELVHADDELLPVVLERYTDVDYMLRYVAVDRTIGHDDGPFHWYCRDTGCSNHNYYWYESTAHDSLWLIPWDLDSSFNLDNSITTIWMPWDDTDSTCDAQTNPPFEVPLRAPTCDKLTLAWAGMQKRWLALVSELLSGPFAEDAVEDNLRTWEAQIEPVVAEAARMHPDAVSVGAWRDALSGLRNTMDTLRERARDRVEQGPREIRDPWPDSDGDALDDN